jgi:hypothetical protein
VLLHFGCQAGICIVIATTNTGVSKALLCYSGLNNN